MDRRKHDRMESLNFIVFTGVDRENKEIAGEIGRTLNVSESGIMLETHVPLASRSSILLDIGLEEDIAAVKGIVVHCSDSGEKLFQAGVDFVDNDQDKIDLIKKYVAAFLKHSSSPEGGNQ